MNKPIRIVRAQHDNKYFAVSRETAQDKTLSWEARGVLLYLLSRPDDWELQPQDLAQGCGINKVYKLLKELDAAGYVKKTVDRDDKKRFIRFIYTVYERPFHENHQMEQKPFDEKPQVEKPQVEKPFVANHHLTEYRDIQSTEKEKNSVAPDGAGEVTATPRKPVHRSDEFKLVALESFAIADVAALDKNTVILVNKIMAWLKTNSPNANVDTLKAFYLWYDSKINAARPRDAAKFGAHFTAFKQQHLLTKRTPPEVIRLPNAVPHEFSVNEFVRKERMHD